MLTVATLLSNRQNQELQKMYKELQARTDSMRRGGGNGGGGMQMMGAMGSISNMSPGLSNHSGGGGGHMVCGLRGGPYSASGDGQSP